MIELPCFQITWFFGDQLTQERVQHAKIAMASVEDQVHQLHEYDGNFHVQMTFLTVGFVTWKWGLQNLYKSI